MIKKFIQERIIAHPATRWVKAIVISLALLSLALWSVPITIAISGIAFILLFHEVGHYIAARASGMKVEELAIGFGPKITGFTKSNIDYSLRLIPLGAFVKIKGMYENEEGVGEAEEPATYRTASYPRRMITILAGPCANFLLAFIALFALHAFVGYPEYANQEWEVGSVAIDLEDGNTSPAYVSGLMQGDRVIAVNGENTTRWEDFIKSIEGKENITLLFTVLRDNEILETRITPRRSNGRATIGIGSQSAIDYNTTSVAAAPIESLITFGEYTVSSAKGVGTIARNFSTLVDDIISPPNDPTTNQNLEARPVSIVGIVQIGGNEEIFNNAEKIFFFAIINIFLGLFNLIPLPPFDGGHCAIATYERIREGKSKKRYMIDGNKMNKFSVVVTSILLILGLGIIYLDLANPII